MKQSNTTALLQVAIQFEKSFNKAQKTFLPNYSADPRIQLVRDCWKFIRGEFYSKDEEVLFMDNHLCGSQEKHEYNLQHAIRLVIDLYKEFFNEIIEKVVEQVSNADEENFEKINEENILKDYQNVPIKIPVESNPFDSIVDNMFQWEHIIERMDKWDYSNADDIYTRAEDGETLSEEELTEYGEIMIPHIKQSLRSLGEMADLLDIQFVNEEE